MERHLHLTAVEEEGYQFKQWSDLVTDNPRTVTITADVTFTAEFEKKSQGMDAIESSDTIHKFVKDGALYIRFGGHVYDAQGQMMK